MEIDLHHHARDKLSRIPDELLHHQLDADLKNKKSDLQQLTLPTTINHHQNLHRPTDQ
jgi:hypothetical protein